MSYRSNTAVPLRTCCLAAALLIVAAQAIAQNPASIDRPQLLSGEGGVIPVRVVDGRIVVSCDISGTQLRVPVNLWLDFDGPFGFQLHNQAAAPLPAETQSGRPSPLTLHFPDFNLTIPRREQGPEEQFEAFTKYHSQEIGENALVGAIGARLLKHFDVIFDLPRGQISLLPIGGLASYQSDPSTGIVVTPVTLQNDRVWLPVTLESVNGQLQRAMAIGSSRYDSIISRRLCNTLGRPAGDVGPVRCESIDFAPYVAFRPVDSVPSHPEQGAGVLGINVLENFRVHVDRQSLLVTLQSARSPSFPQEELEWFQAMVAGDVSLVQDWLQQYSQTRLGREAAEFLLTLLLDKQADEQQLLQAIQWVNDTMPKDLRATRLFELMEELVNAGQQQLGIAAGSLGVKSSSRGPLSRFKLQAAWPAGRTVAADRQPRGLATPLVGRVRVARGRNDQSESRSLL